MRKAGCGDSRVYTSVNSATRDVTTPIGCIRWHWQLLHGEQDNLKPDSPDVRGINVQLQTLRVLSDKSKTCPIRLYQQCKVETQTEEIGRKE